MHPGPREKEDWDKNGKLHKTSIHTWPLPCYAAAGIVTTRNLFSSENQNKKKQEREKFLRQVIGPFLFRSGSSFIFIFVLYIQPREFDLLRMFLGVIYGDGASLQFSIYSISVASSLHLRLLLYFQSNTEFERTKVNSIVRPSYWTLLPRERSQKWIWTR